MENRKYEMGIVNREKGNRKWKTANGKRQMGNGKQEISSLILEPNYPGRLDTRPKISRGLDNKATISRGI